MHKPTLHELRISSFATRQVLGCSEQSLYAGNFEIRRGFRSYGRLSRFSLERQGQSSRSARYPREPMPKQHVRTRDRCRADSRQPSQTDA
jgi:hypothetical protein